MPQIQSLTLLGLKETFSWGSVCRGLGHDPGDADLLSVGGPWPYLTGSPLYLEETRSLAFHLPWGNSCGLQKSRRRRTTPGLVLSWVIVPASQGAAGRSKQDRALMASGTDRAAFLGSVLLLPGKREPGQYTCAQDMHEGTNHDTEILVCAPSQSNAMSLQGARTPEHATSGSWAGTLRAPALWERAGARLWDWGKNHRSRHFDNTFTNCFCLFFLF